MISKYPLLRRFSQVVIEDINNWKIRNNVTQKFNHKGLESTQIHRESRPPISNSSTPTNALIIRMVIPLPPIRLPTQPRKLMNMCISARQGKNCDHCSRLAHTMLTTNLHFCWSRLRKAISCPASFVTLFICLFILFNVDFCHFTMK